MVRDLKDAASFVRKIPFLKLKKIAILVKEVSILGRKMKIVENNKKHLTKEEKIARKSIQDKASDGLEKATPKKSRSSCFRNVLYLVRGL